MVVAAMERSAVGTGSRTDTDTTAAAMEGSPAVTATTGGAMDSRIAMATIVVTDIPRAVTLMAGYPTVTPGAIMVILGATMLIPGGITDTLTIIPTLSGTTATEERKRQSERARGSDEETGKEDWGQSLFDR